MTQVTAAPKSASMANAKSQMDLGLCLSISMTDRLVARPGLGKVPAVPVRQPARWTTRSTSTLRAVQATIWLKPVSMATVNVNLGNGQNGGTAEGARVERGWVE